MVSSYPTCFIKEEDGYTVIFPDLGNVATCGSDLEEAEYMAVDCLAGYLLWLEEDGEAVPEPSAEEAVSVSELLHWLELDEAEAFVKTISVDVKEYAKAHF